MKLGTGSKYKNMEVAESAASWIIPVFMEGKIIVPFPAVNAQTQGKITYNIH